MRVVNRISWLLYIVGTALILGSYVGVVTAGVGWFGWVIAMSGWVVGRIPGVRRPGTTEQLSQLAKLYAAGKLTDDEYTTAKARVLGVKAGPPPTVGQ